MTDQPMLLDGTLRERPLGGGETHAYTLSLASDHYLRLSVDQRGIDVEVRLVAPDDELLIAVDGLTGARGAEVVTAWKLRAQG
jgi:hypothetical protein